MRKIQEVVRSINGVNWIKGLSKCYRDVTTSKSTLKTKVRYKFEYVNLELNGRTREQLASEILAALQDEGHVVEVFPDPHFHNYAFPPVECFVDAARDLGEIYIYQEFRTLVHEQAEL